MSKKTITVKCKESGDTMLSRHCYEHVVPKIKKSMIGEAATMQKKTISDVKKSITVDVTDKIEF